MWFESPAETAGNRLGMKQNCKLVCWVDSLISRRKKDQIRFYPLKIVGAKQHYEILFQTKRIIGVSDAQKYIGRCFLALHGSYSTSSTMLPMLESAKFLCHLVPSMMFCVSCCVKEMPDLAEQLRPRSVEASFNRLKSTHQSITFRIF